MSAAPNLFIFRAKRLLHAGTMILLALPASAGEVETECPMIHPEKPGVRLRSGECLPDGETKWVHVSDEMTDHGNNIFTEIDIHKTPNSRPLRKAKIECNYKDKSIVLVPVPGELLRCGIRYRLPVFKNIGANGKGEWDGEWEAFRIWAVSETEDKPETPK